MGEKIDFALGFLHRRHRSILIGLLAALPLGLLYFVLAPPSYTASSTMMIETQYNQTPGQNHAAPDSGWIESQIGILRSGNVAAYVVKQLRLADDPKFIRDSTGLIGKIFDRLGLTSPPSTDAERAAAATSVVMGGLDVRRIGLSYML